MYSLRAAYRKLNNDLDGAISDAEQAAQLASDGLLETYYKELAQFKLAAGDIDGMEKTALVPIEKKKSSEAYKTRAELRLEAKNFDGALEDIEAALKIDDDRAKHAWLYGLQADIYLAKKKTEQAIQSLNVAIENAPTFASNYAKRSEARVLLKEIEPAISDAQKAIELAPGNYSYRLQLAKIYRDQSKFQPELDVWNAWLQATPGSVNGLVYRARVKEKLKDFDGARKDFESSLALQADYAFALESYGAFLVNRGEMEAALERYTQSIRAAPDEYRRYFVRGNVLYDNEFYAESVTDYRDVLRLKPDHALVHAYLGDAHVMIGKIEEARANYAKALELAPNQADVLQTIAAMLSQTGNKDVRDTRRAVELAKKACEVAEWKSTTPIRIYTIALLNNGDKPELLRLLDSDPFRALSASDRADVITLLAWHAASDEIDHIRDIQLATDFLERATALASEPDSTRLMTQAALAAEQKDFSKAVQLMEQAIPLLTRQVSKARADEYLALLKNNKTFRRKPE